MVGYLRQPRDHRPYVMAFHSLGKILVVKDEFMMCVRGPEITCKQSLMIRMFILSGPGYLIFSIAIMIRRTLMQVTGLKLDCCSKG